MQKYDKTRVEFLSDGILAIIMTIMVLDITLPEAPFSLSQMMAFGYSIMVFFVSFFVVATQWYRHHFYFARVETLSFSVIWKNFLFLALVSLLPLFTSWIMDNPSERVPALSYDVLYIVLNIASQFLKKAIVNEHPELKEKFEDMIKGRRKNMGGIPWLFYFFLVVVAISFIWPSFSTMLFTVLPVLFSVIVQFLNASRERKEEEPSEG